MDGTLYSSEPIIEKVYAQSVKILNQEKNTQYTAPNFKTIEPLIGQPVKLIYQSLFPNISQENMSFLGATIMQGFQKAIKTYGGILFEGADKVLQTLQNQGFQVFVASNGRREYLEAIIHKFNLSFAPFVCVEEYGIQNKSQILAWYLKNYSLKPSEMIMVGDRASDLIAARDNQCFFIGCHFGHGPLEEIQTADVLVNHLSEIPKIIQNLEQKVS